MHAYISIALTLFLMGCASRATNPQKEAYLHLQMGTTHLENQRYPEALNELLTAEKLDPENAITQNNLGIAYFVRQKFSEAERHLRRALEIEPRYTEARNNLGRVLIEMGFAGDAVKELTIAVQDLTYQSPEKSKSNLGIAYFKLNDFNQALNYLGESLQLRSQHCLTSSYYARTLFELAKYEESALAFDQASNMCRDEKFDEPIYFGGLAYFKLKKLDIARARFEEVVGSFPDGIYAEQSQKMLRILNK